ncbi:ribosome biogenesis protein YTM1 [Crucibulum laeve]|uniref:Ribosome biogenesis protein YTM1 n=1 Tax=Crucibulum laeve TaxID=68775 RepID=A0A5C3LGC0_9AGAR|nr:ribosome biogenesis protein YTM1 [Crucibulum laeve]
MASTSTSVVSQPVFFTTLTQYPLPSQKFMIPTLWKRYQLSQLVNKALALETPVPFDFLVRGELLRTTLGDWCAEHGVGEEETLEIEYIESVMPPQKISDLPHDDWVSSVSCDLPGYFLTSSYDGQIRVFNYSKALASSAPAHAAPITSICVVPTPNNTDESTTHLIASASHDLTAQLTQVKLDAIPSNSSSKLIASLHLHTAPLSSIASNSTGSHLLTSSWDGLIGLWDTLIPIEDEVPEPTANERDRKKRRKIEAAAGKGKRKAPVTVLKSHTARVSKVVFAPTGGDKAYSCGFDSTVRVWDTENGVCTQTITAAEKPFLDLAITPDGNSALAMSTDRTMSLYDLRTTSTTSLTLSSASFMHAATPTCVVAASNNSNQVVTGAYDGVVRLWDLRSTKGAIASFKPWEGKKVLSVDWKRGLVGVGGEGGFEVWKVGEERT